MSDPFDVLRGSAGRGAPDVGAIRSRARRIERRRRVAISSAAIVIVAVAVGGVLLRPGGGGVSNTTTVAQSRTNPTPTSGAGFRALAPAAASGATSSAAGTAAQTNAADKRAATKGETSGQAAAPMAAPAPAARSSGTLQLTITAAPAGPPHMERFTLKACNPSSSAVAPTFPTGQRYDFEVRSGGSLVWRWSDGMAFTQMYGQESWAAKQCKTYTATWNGTNSSSAPQPTGSYQVTGILTSSQRPSTARMFCLDLC